LASVKKWIASADTDEAMRYRGRGARAFCRWATEEEVADYSWWKRIPLVQVAIKPQPTVTPEDVSAALRAAKSPRDKALVAVLWSSGLRASEVARMNVEDLDLAGGWVMVPKTKSGKPRVAPLDHQAVKALRKWMRSEGTTEGPLWLGTKGPLTTSGISQVLRRLGLPTAHAWRRGWAVHALRQGISQVSVQAAAGWNSGAMVTRYTSAVAGELSMSEFSDRW
jgi:integrase